MAKQKYNIGDTVWVAGIQHNKLTEGTVVYEVNIPGIHGTQYIISIPTHIEPLLEIRTWETISEDEHGPVGMLRSLGTELSVTNRVIKKVGYDTIETVDDEPSDDEILAALAKSQKVGEHEPLVLKTNTNKRRRYYKKKKQ